jgi:hypothetical protein
MSARTPPAPDGKPTGSDYVSSNGATSKLQSDSSLRLVVVAYITAVTLPLIGFVLGIVVITRPNRVTSRHGRWIILISIVSTVVWVLVLSSSILTTPSNDVGY